MFRRQLVQPQDQEYVSLCDVLIYVFEKNNTDSRAGLLRRYKRYTWLQPQAHTFWEKNILFLDERRGSFAAIPLSINLEELIDTLEHVANQSILAQNSEWKQDLRQALADHAEQVSSSSIQSLMDSSKINAITIDEQEKQEKEKPGTLTLTLTKTKDTTQTLTLKQVERNTTVVDPESKQVVSSSSSFQRTAWMPQTTITETVEARMHGIATTMAWIGANDLATHPLNPEELDELVKQVEQDSFSTPKDKQEARELIASYSLTRTYDKITKLAQPGGKQEQYTDFNPFKKEKKEEEEEEPPQKRNDDGLDYHEYDETREWVEPDRTGGPKYHGRDLSKNASTLPPSLDQIIARHQLQVDEDDYLQKTFEIAKLRSKTLLKK